MASKKRTQRRRANKAARRPAPLPPIVEQAEEDKARRKGRRFARGRRALLFAVAILCALWTLLVTALPPTVLRGVLESQLSAAVNAPVTLESVRVNPFTLAVSVRGVRVPYLDGGDGALLTIEKLELIPHLRPFENAAPVQASLRVFNPVLDILYLGNGAFSFSALLPEKAAAPETPSAPLFALSDLDLRGGTVILRDGPVGITHTISNVDFNAPLLPSKDTPFAPTLTARVNGTPIEVRGRIEPDADTVRTVFAIRTAPLHMEHFRRYLAEFTPLRLNSGTVEADMAFTLSQPRPGLVATSLSGTVLVADVEIASPEGAVIGRLRRGHAKLDDFTLSERRIRLEEMELDGLYLRVSRNEAGRIDWEAWLGPEGTPDDTPFVVEGADLILRNSDFTWADAALADTQVIEITGVDGRIAEFSTRPGARTAMRLSFGISTEGVLAVDGEGTLNPPSLHADLWVDDLPLIVLRPLLGGTPLSDILGRVAVKGGVRFGTGRTEEADGAAQPPSAPYLAISNAEASLKDLSFGRGNSLSAADRKAGKDTGTPAVRVRALACGGLNFDTRARTASVRKLSVTGPTLRVSTADGVELAIPGAKPTPAKRTPAVRTNLPAGLVASALPDAAATVLTGWKLKADAFSLTQGTIRDTQNVLVENLSLATGPLTQDLRQSVSFTLGGGTAPGNALKAKGTLRPIPLRVSARLDASGLPLDLLARPLRGLIGLSPSGTFDAGLDAEVEEQSETFGIRATGAFTARDATIKDARSGKTYATLRRLAVDKLRFSSAGTFEAGDVLADRLRMDVALTPSGTLDIVECLNPGSKGGGSPFTFAVSKLRLQDAALLFRDRLHAAGAAVQDIDATFTNLTSSGMADVVLTGQLGGAPITLSGKLNPFSTPPAAALDFTAKGVDLARYSAYAKTYLGYPVLQGRLDLESVFRTSGWTFTLDNRIKLEKPVLGPKDTRPGAPDYPLPLGLALLEDLRGNVTLDLPVSGRLDASAMQVGGLVGKAVGGLFAKVVTSPFALLGGIVSLVTPSDPAVQLVAFPPGETRLNPAARERLKRIAKALESYPKVKIELIGMYEPTSDTRGLKRQRVLRKVRARGGKSAEASLKPAEYERLLRQVYKASPAGKNDRKNEEPDVMEQRLQALENVGKADLETLARSRAEQVRAFLLRQSPGLAKRISLAVKGGSPLVRAGTAQVELQLR